MRVIPDTVSELYWPDLTVTSYGPPGFKPPALNLPVELVVLEKVEFVGL